MIEFWQGVAVGIGLTFVLWVLSDRAYRRTLLDCAKLETPERLPDGRFYYLLEESRYIELRTVEFARDRLAIEAAQREVRSC